jgi:hypothetical protein
MDQQACSEKPCPWPVEPGQTLCGHHLRMFSYALEKDEEEDELVDTRYSARDRGSQIGSAIGREELSVSTPGMGLVELEEKREAARFKKVFERARSAERYRRRVSAGLCALCGQPREAASIRCLKCRKKNTDAIKKYYLRLRREGICTNCKTRQAAPSRTYCSECLTERRLKKRKAARNKMGFPASARCYSTMQVATLLEINYGTLVRWVKNHKVRPTGSRMWSRGGTQLAWSDSDVKAVSKYKERNYKRQPKKPRKPKSYYRKASRVATCARYQRLKRLALCIRCGKPNDGGVYCLQHHEEERVRGRDWMRARSAALRLARPKPNIAENCIRCQKPNTSKSSDVCRLCKNRERYQFRKLSGICVTCCREKAVAGKVLCEGCQRKALPGNVEKARIVRVHRRAEGLCVGCGQARIEGNHFCEDCRAKEKSRREHNRRPRKPFRDTPRGAQLHRNYLALIGSGFCSACRQQNDNLPHVRCKTCSSSHREQMRKKNRQKVLQTVSAA